MVRGVRGGLSSFLYLWPFEVPSFSVCLFQAEVNHAQVPVQVPGWCLQVSTGAIADRGHDICDAARSYQ